MVGRQTSPTSDAQTGARFGGAMCLDVAGRPLCLAHGRLAIFLHPHLSQYHTVASPSPDALVYHLCLDGVNAARIARLIRRILLLTEHGDGISLIIAYPSSRLLFLHCITSALSFGGARAVGIG
jgi:hypothetical protein